MYVILINIVCKLETWTSKTVVFSKNGIVSGLVAIVLLFHSGGGISYVRIYNI